MVASHASLVHASASSHLATWVQALFTHLPTVQASASAQSPSVVHWPATHPAMASCRQPSTRLQLSTVHGSASPQSLGNSTHPPAASVQPATTHWLVTGHVRLYDTHVPVPESQASTVHVSPSSGQVRRSMTHTLPTQVADSRQRSTSGLPQSVSASQQSVSGSCTHSPSAHESAVQGLSSSQSRAS